MKEMEFGDILRRLVAAYGPPGREAGVAAEITTLIRPYVDEVTTDAIGNVTATMRGPGETAGRLLLMAHMDVPGLVVTEITKDGTLRLSPAGTLNTAFLPGLRVVSGRGTIGVVCLAPKLEAKDVGPAKMHIDIGVESDEAARPLVSVGDFFVPHPELADLQTVVSGPALDNRAGCAVLIETARGLAAGSGASNVPAGAVATTVTAGAGGGASTGRPPGTIVFAFTVQGAIGARGSRTVTYGARPDLALVIDASPVGAGDGGRPVEPGKGPVLRLRDGPFILSPALRVELERCAEATGIPLQYEIIPAPGSHTDPCGVETSADGVRTGVLGLAVRNPGTASEIMAPSDLLALAALLRAFLARPAGREAPTADVGPEGEAR